MGHAPRTPRLLFLLLAGTVLLSQPLAQAQVSLHQVLAIGDSITGNWSDLPVRYGFYSQQACTIRLHLSAALAQQPQTRLLIIEAGTNDLIDGPGGGYDCGLPLQDAVSSVVDMVKTGKAAGLQVFVLSVLPISWANRAGQPVDPLVPPFNAQLQSAITAVGAHWVDDYDAFVGHPEYQIDGVHPNEAGYQVIEGILEADICADTTDCADANLRVR